MRISDWSSDVCSSDLLIRASAPIIPTIAAGADFNAQIPQCLQPINGLTRRADDPNMTELASTMLECVGLLRRQRRVFVSYRRVESRAAALQLHDLLAFPDSTYSWIRTTLDPAIRSKMCFGIGSLILMLWLCSTRLPISIAAGRDRK